MPRLSRLLSLVALLLAACATARTAGDDAKVSVVVENNLIPPTSLSVYAVPEVGARKMLGVLQPSTTRTFTFDPIGPDSYRLVAEATPGREIVSRPFLLSDDISSVRWNLSVNTIEFIE